MESGEITNNQVWASSYTPGRNPEFARIGHESSWAPKDNDDRPYLEVSFLDFTEITAVSTQGGGDGKFVRRFMVEYADSEGVKIVNEEVVGEDGVMTERPVVFEGEEYRRMWICMSASFIFPITSFQSHFSGLDFVDLQVQLRMKQIVSNTLKYNCGLDL